MKNETTSSAVSQKPKFSDKIKTFFKKHGFDTFGWAYTLIILFLVYAPIIVLIVYSFVNSRNIGGSGEFTFDLYVQLFNNTEILTATGNTLLLAAISGVLATLIGTFAAVGTYYMRKWKLLVNLINQITIVNVEIVTAVAFMLFFVFLQTVNLGIPEGYPTLIISHTMITTPFVIMSVTPRLAQLDPNAYEAGLDLGASPMRSMFTVIIPQLLPAMISGFALAFTLSMDDFVISKFNRGSVYTISTLLYEMVAKRGINPAFRALSTIIFVVIITVLIAYNIIQDRRMRKKRAA